MWGFVLFVTEPSRKERIRDNIDSQRGKTSPQQPAREIPACARDPARDFPHSPGVHKTPRPEIRGSGGV